MSVDPLDWNLSGRYEPWKAPLQLLAASWNSLTINKIGSLSFEVDILELPRS